LSPPDFARNLSDLYGWPFFYRLAAPNEPPGGSYVVALAADLAIALALLASACATTQVAACPLVRSARNTLRIIGVHPDPARPYREETRVCLFDQNELCLVSRQDLRLGGLQEANTACPAPHRLNGAHAFPEALKEGQPGGRP
jgi:hypothetical protein